MRLAEPAFWNDTALGRRLRWALLLPGVVVASFLSTYLLRAFILIASGDDGMVSFGPEGARQLEFWAGPFAHSVALVWSSAYIAPSHKFSTALALAGAWGGAILVLLVLTYSGALPIEPGPPLRAVVGVAGAAVGLWIAKGLDQDSAEG